MKTIIIRVARNFYVALAIYSAVLFTVLFEIVIGIVYAVEKDLNDLVNTQFVILGFVGVCIIGYALSEILNRKKLVITEEEIVRYKGKKLIYKINKSDVLKILYIKPGIITRLLFLLAEIMNIPFVGMVSIRYKNADIDGPKAHHSYEELDTLEDEEKESGMKERLELLSAREVKKICAVLGKEVSYI